MKLQEIEGSPLGPEEVEMFEMFERQGWSNARRRAYVAERLKALAKRN